MQKNRLSLLFSAILTASLAQPAQAIIIGGEVTGGTAKTIDGGVFIKLTLPFDPPNGSRNTVGNNTFQTSNLYGFDEAQNALIGQGELIVDILASGGPGLIPAGTEVASHYIFFDPDLDRTQVGYVDFDADILAIITRTTYLSASDYLANTGVTYQNPSLRGLESGDKVYIDPTLPYRLHVDWRASSPGDYIRVLTKHSPGAAVPEGGSTVLLLGMALTGVVGVRRLRGTV